MYLFQLQKPKLLNLNVDELIHSKTDFSLQRIDFVELKKYFLASS